METTEDTVIGISKKELIKMEAEKKQMEEINKLYLQAYNDSKYKDAVRTAKQMKDGFAKQMKDGLRSAKHMKAVLKELDSVDQSLERKAGRLKYDVEFLHQLMTETNDNFFTIMRNLSGQIRE
jgi:predicted enzyme involved in methoxymalonyl-ACP biosynthesis